MKRIAHISLFTGLFCILAAALSAPASAQDIQLGDTKEKVLDVLGFPQGQMAVGGGIVLLYKRGTVTIEKGKVTGTTIVSQADLKAQKAEKTREEAARKAAAAAARAKRIANGRAEKSRKEMDQTFAAKPAAERLAYWRGFQKKYPEVSVAGKIAPLAEEVEGAEKAKRKKIVTERIAKLKSEVIPATQKDSVRQYQSGGTRKRRAARVKLKELKAELAKLEAELKTL